MNFSGQYRPTCTVSDVKELLNSLKVPEPKSVTFPISQGQLNQIVVLEWAEEKLKEILISQDINPRPDDSSTCLLLRIASKEMPHIKVENEAAVLMWLASSTTIPVPQIFRHDSTINNTLQHEYIIMTYSRGVTGSVLYPKLKKDQMDYILDQLASQTLQLFRSSFKGVSGLKTTPENDIVPGPFLDPNQWTVPEIEKHWPPNIKYTDLTPIATNGFPTFVDYLVAKLDCSINACSAHPALQSLPYLSYASIQLLKTFMKVISTPAQATILNDLTYVLAHTDLHFGQLLIDPETARITAILDWEFAGIVPAPLWQGSFLWNGDTTAQSPENVRIERNILRKRWASQLFKLDYDGAKDFEERTAWKHKEQAAAWDVVNLMRCIVEVVPRGVQLDDAKRWWTEIVQALAILGVRSSTGGSSSFGGRARGSVSSMGAVSGDPDATEADAKRKLEEQSSNETFVGAAVHDILVNRPIE